MDCPAGFPGHHQLYYAWFEWWPNPENLIKDWPVVPGQIMEVNVRRNTTLRDSFDVNFYNVATGQTRAYNVGPPASTPFVGDSVEWIVEAPQVNGAQSQLALYDTSFWTLLFDHTEFPSNY
jgi:hypothetical protein